MSEVWIARVWKVHGEDTSVHGVYDSREAALDALKELPGLTVYVDAEGNVQGRPPGWDRSKKLHWTSLPEYWATAEAYQVQGRVKPQAGSQPRT